MSALQKIRSKSTLLVGVIAVGLLAFVVPWGEITQFLNVSKDKAFVVNGDVIKTGQYNARIEQREELAKMMTQDGQLDEFQLAQVREEVYQTMVKEILLADQAERIGLQVSDAELNDMVHGVGISPVLYEIPYFIDPQTGQFNRAALNQLITEIKKPDSQDLTIRAQQDELRKLWSYIENRMRSTRLEEKYTSLVASAVLVNDLELKAYQADSKDVATIAYVSKDYKEIDDATIEVSDKEIQDLYNIRKENFLSKNPTRSISYFVKNVIPSEADFEDVKSQMLLVKSELASTDNAGMIANQYSSTPFIDAYFSLKNYPTEVVNFVNSSSVGDINEPMRGNREYTMYKYVARTLAPDSVKIQVLPIQSFDPTQVAVIADSLQNVLKQGKSFAMLAQEMYPGTPGMGTGEWVNEAMLASTGVAEQCFTAAKGSVLKMDLQGMTALVKIEDRTNPVTKVKVATITMPVIVSDKTNNAADNEINKFVSENKVPAEFEQAALNAGYNLIADAIIEPDYFGLGFNPMSRNPRATFIPGTREVIKWAFNDDDGNIKKFETKDARVVALVKDKTKEGFLPVSNKNVREVLTAEIRRDKKAEQLIAELKGKNATSLVALAQAIDSKVDSAKFVTFQTPYIGQLGFEPVLNVYAKSGKENSLTQPLKGNQGVYVLDVVSRTQDSAEQSKAQLQDAYTNILAQSASYLLMKKMDVEDNRITFY